MSRTLPAALVTVSLSISLSTSAQVLVDSIPYPGINQGFWGIHVDADTIFLGADFSGAIHFSDHEGTILGQVATDFDFNHGLVRRPSSYLVAEDYTSGGAGLYEIGLDGTTLNSWTFPPVIGGNSSGIGDLCADGAALWYTMYYPDFDVYPYAYAYKWVPGDPTPIDTVPMNGEQPYGIALKGDTLLYATDNLNGDPERIYAYDLTNEVNLGFVDLPDMATDGDQSPRGMYYDGQFLYLIADRQGGSAFAYQTVFKYAFDISTAVFIRAEPVEMSIHPSPASDVVTLQLSGNVALPYAVFDATGKHIVAGTMNTDRTTLNVADWAPGAYTVKIGATSRRF
ncbi:MAG: T9SS type A sorting domain-containing protein, partial [Flavobacteriales bacterium]|nr:T9SS type A sorting domain-containing protein [Flavobacteriales bacterium]